MNSINSIKGKLYFLVALFAVGTLIILAYSWKVLDTVKINGSMYRNIMQGKDLVADILPPPEYAIETYLTVFELYHAEDKTEREELIQKLGQLKKDYEERHDFWRKTLLEGRVKDLLINSSYDPAVRFFQLIQDNFIPAIQKNDVELAKSIIFDELRPFYLQHRSFIDQVVTLSTENNATYEEHTRSYISRRTMWQALFGILLCVLGLLVGVTLSRRITGNVQLVATGLRALAKGDLTTRVEVSSKDEIGEMARALNETIADLHGIMSEINEAAAQAAASSEELSATAQSMSTGSQQQASAVEEICASVEKLAATIVNVTENAKMASEVADKTKTTASKGNEAVGNSIRSMKLINESSEKISKIVGMISQIANQTNLLALNAAIEAASAGEHGLGFAVVADEVRKLAERSSMAAEEITQLIKESTTRVHDGSKLSDEVSVSLAEILGGIEQTNSSMTLIRSVTTAQSATASEVSKGVELVSRVTEENSASAEELSGSAEELAAQAQKLQGLVSHFKMST